MQQDWRNPILSPFLALVVIVPTLLAACCAACSFRSGASSSPCCRPWLVSVGGWSTGQWIINDLYDECMHPGYLLPTATGGFVGSIVASEAHLYLLAKAWFGVGMVSWLLVASIILNRLFIRPKLPPLLMPTIALEAVIFPWLRVSHTSHCTVGPIDAFAAGLGGYAILMVMVQLRLAPVYSSRLGFTPASGRSRSQQPPSAWTESSGSRRRDPGGFTAYTAIVLGLVTLVIATVATRSVLALSRHQFFPSTPATVALEAMDVPEPSAPDSAS